VAKVRRTILQQQGILLASLYLFRGFRSGPKLFEGRLRAEKGFGLFKPRSWMVFDRADQISESGATLSLNRALNWD
jgi:hypothetical protein